MENIISVEHHHLPKSQLPLKLWADFPNGSLLVFIEEELYIAAPATPRQCDQLTVLIAEGDPSAYHTFLEQIRNDELMEKFEAEMDKMQAADEAREQMPAVKKVEYSH